MKKYAEEVYTEVPQLCVRYSDTPLSVLRTNQRLAFRRSGNFFYILVANQYIRLL